MAKKWKIIISVVSALVIVGCVAAPIVGVVFFRGRFHEVGWEPQALHRWEPGELHRWKPDEAQYHEFEVELVDDDGDGVPDRGVIEFPMQATFGPGHRLPFDWAQGGPFGWAQGRPFGHGRFGPGGGMTFGGHAFGFFFVLRGLAHLALLVVVILLGVAFYRHWRKAHPVTPPASEQ
jgi:hypothetical protein